MTQADLARSVLVRPQSIAPLLDGLRSAAYPPHRRPRPRTPNPVRLTGPAEALNAVWDVALSTNDLTDAGLTASESAELNRLLLKIVHTTQATKLEGFYE